MGDLTKNFSRKEFACRCGCGFDHISLQLVEELQDVRDHFGSSVAINSACRCEEHNQRVGGSRGSKHKLGIAADFTVKGVSNKEVQAYLLSKHKDRYGIGVYSTFTHLDVRDGKARW